MHVLLIEPDKILGDALTHVVTEQGMTVQRARTAQTALDALDEKLPDIIVLELQLGTHNGIEFLYEIRSYPEWQQIPVIVHTMNKNVLDPIFADAFEQLGVRAVLYKPRTKATQLVSLLTALPVAS